ncbi:gamma-glutamyl-gamma-aminobutyrate hydrolase family protein, partial [Alphaproteobacteria bacterium]|nr:gamma-glutamyl-gamma-aminobutyrate hydrolase family protein [Alphaproteobacteria bacterium]
RRVGRILKQLGFYIEIKKPCIGDQLPDNLSNYNGVIVFGGPMSVYESNKYSFLEQELEWLPKVISKQKPLLGICLGAQLIAKSLGADVYPHRKSKHEVGYYPVFPTINGKKYFNNESIINAYQFHKDTFDLPKGAELIAEGKLFKHQAFKYKKHVTGIQFHPEVTPKTMIQWSNLALKRNIKEVQPIKELINLSMKNDNKIRDWIKNFLAEEIQ